MKKFAVLILLSMATGVYAQNPVLHWRFANAYTFFDVNTSETKLSFDVELSCDHPGTFHSDIQLVFKYNTLAFGENIVSNGKISYERLPLMQGGVGGTQKYAIYGHTNTAPSRYTIMSEAQFLLANPTYMNEVPELPQWEGYFRFEIVVDDPSELAGIDFYPSLMNGKQKYVDATHPNPVKYGYPPGYEGVYVNDLLN